MCSSIMCISYLLGPVRSIANTIFSKATIDDSNTTWKPLLGVRYDYH
jgi:hypothetical protein